VWLLDANIDVRVREILAEFGVEGHTAQSLGWKELSNGNLVAASAEAGFTCLLTRDQLFSESAARTLALFPTFAIVVIELRQQKWPAYGEAFRRMWEREPIVPKPGQSISWPQK
jgi:predicted nuclease of predicted toxin-antitoxin system